MDHIHTPHSDQIVHMMNALRELHKLAIKKKLKPPKMFSDFVRKQVENGICPLICMDHI